MDDINRQNSDNSDLQALFGQLQKTNMERAKESYSLQQVEEIKKELLGKGPGYVVDMPKENAMTGSLARADPSPKAQMPTQESIKFELTGTNAMRNSN